MASQPLLSKSTSFHNCKIWENFGRAYDVYENNSSAAKAAFILNLNQDLFSQFGQMPWNLLCVTVV